MLPVSLLNGSIFYWVFTALSSLMETLKERCQFEKLLLFQRLWKILIFALSIATFTLLFQIFNLSLDVTARWKYQWLLTDGVSHGLFLFILAAMMYLWAPHKYSQRYAYSTEISGKELELGARVADHGNAVWAEEEDDDNDDADSFWATTHGRDADHSNAPVDVIGASHSSGEKL
uniref:GOST seven transmembrane domain-containing protein n=1 Tax=Alexandrium andersonii TaxID=327968 RepID=A0A7S2BJV9_9DINO